MRKTHHSPTVQPKSWAASAAWYSSGARAPKPSHKHRLHAENVCNRFARFRCSKSTTDKNMLSGIRANLNKHCLRDKLGAETTFFTNPRCEELNDKA